MQRFLQVSTDVLLQTGPDDSPPGRTQQGGVAFYTLCEDCNNYCGRWYVPEYIRWAHGGVDILNRFPEGLDGVLITAPETHPLHLIKEVAAMFLTVNPMSFRNSPDGAALAQFVLDREATGVPPAPRFFGYLNQEGRFRYIPLGMKINLYKGTFCHLSEITYPPFGWVMTHDSDPPDDRLAEFTEFGNVPYNANASIEVGMNRLPTHLAFGFGDYRSREELSETERLNLEAEQREVTEDAT